MHIVAATNVKTVLPYPTLFTFAVAVKVVDPSHPESLYSFLCIVELVIVLNIAEISLA